MNRLSIAVLVFICLIAVPCAPASAAPHAMPHGMPFAISQSEDAVAYQINRTHTGAIDGPTLQLPLTVRWNVAVGQASTYPVIANGRVFVGGPSLYALNATTGATLWSKSSPSIGTAFDNRKLFTLSGGGQLAELNPATGRQIWFTSLQGQYAFSSPPTAGNGMVYTGGAGSGGTVYAVSEANGSTIWTQSVQNGDDSSPVVTPTGVFVSYVCPQTYDFNPVTGALIWHYSGPCEGGGGATAVLYGGLLYTESWASNPNGLILKASDGSPVGTFASLVTPAFAKNIGYFVENSNGSLVAINTKTGNTVWTQSLSGDAFSVPPIVVTNTLSGDLVIDATAAGNLNVYNAQTGQLLQTLSLGAGAESGMGFSEGLLVVPAGNSVVGLQ